MPVYSIYVEKKPSYAVEAVGVLADIHTALQMESVTRVRLINGYYVEHISQSDFDAARHTVFSEPQVDRVYDRLPNPGGCRILGVEYLPGQFDQRADSCAQCISLATGKDRPLVCTLRIYLMEGEITDGEFDRIRRHLINPVECRETDLTPPDTLESDYAVPTKVETLSGFTGLDEDGLAAFLQDYSLAMDLDDLRFCRDYFQKEGRDPTITEIRVIDTYWSDHCRHTTFLTRLEDIRIEPSYIKESFEKYLGLRGELYADREKPVTLMDLATIGAKALRARGLLPDLDESEEINACSVKVKAKVNGKDQDWLLMFKNETHNHPTEIEPFGGAATCLGGAIRDPLSGRSYVYQAMRVTGAGNPLAKVADTLPGKLPQRKLVTTAAAGYSSYGNQIGLATGHVHEIYHPGYIAKRMEIGAVIGAAPAENVVRKRPQPGDLVILLGGRTGRDGCGGATGSSKSHTAESLSTCGAEVQKGNPPEERKLQRLFRNPNVSRLIKRCNDFGAGGVSVAIGELAEGLEIDLDKVPKKYDGLDGTELAISESQERMAAVIAPHNLDVFLNAAKSENLEATVVAKVTDRSRLAMDWSGARVVDIAREFLGSNGAPKSASALIGEPVLSLEPMPLESQADWEAFLSDLNRCSQKGLVERFDSTIGAGTLLMPFGGRYQLTPAQAMAAQLPVPEGETTSCSVMGWGFDPDISQRSPYHGAMLAVVESVAKVVAAGGGIDRCWLTFQEYFPRTKGDPARWGLPLSALLGALEAQLGLGVAAIGGKDSMSGSFEDLDVPPTLVSFAVSVADARNIISPELKGSGNSLYLLVPEYDENGLPDLAGVKSVLRKTESLIKSGQAASAWALTGGGVAEAVAKMSFGNRVGVRFVKELEPGLMSRGVIGGILLEGADIPGLEDSRVAVTIEDYAILTANGTRIDMGGVQAVWEEKLAPVYPYLTPSSFRRPETFSYSAGQKRSGSASFAKPAVVIPVFPGTNCEYDTARAFERVGMKTEILVLRNLTASDVKESVKAFADMIGRNQIIAIPGGFSGGDEPEGSGKFITAFFRNPQITQEVHRLLRERDGLILGICNGFQALVKLGLLPYGEIRQTDEACPTLTFNSVGRHQSMMVRTRIASNKSPWLMHYQVGDIHTVPVSHGEGRFVADEVLIRRMAENGQIATQYVDLNGAPSMDVRYNPNNSVCAIEGITDLTGRIFGKMAHSERAGEHLYANIHGDKDMNLFLGAAQYYR